LIAARLATEERPADHYREVKHIGRAAQGMVRDALDASPASMPTWPCARRGAIASSTKNTNPSSASASPS